MNLTVQRTVKRIADSAWSVTGFVAKLAAAMWAAHAVGFFMHEYAHSTLAWLLGWKANPLALNYATPTVAVFLLQGGISENVDYAPIFASGHRWQAASIAAAGMVVGNGLITYPLSLWGVHRRGLSRGWPMFFYWLLVASVGNFIDYVPLRTFGSDGDMHTLERGFGCSPWWVLLILGIPITIAVVHLLFRVQPEVLWRLFPRSPARRVAMACLTALALFGFYGAAGIEESDPVSRRMSVISVMALVPLMALAGWCVVRRNDPTAADSAASDSTAASS